MFEELAQCLLIISVGTNSGQNIGPVSSTRHVSPARTGENKNLTRLLMNISIVVYKYWTG